jgi:uncharacterized protein YodC (DUF2158 family)
MKFKVGDTVQLKSGGPVMTVDSVHSEKDKSVLCIWFVGGTVTIPWDRKQGAFTCEG